MTHHVLCRLYIMSTVYTANTYMNKIPFTGRVHYTRELCYLALNSIGQVTIGTLARSFCISCSERYGRLQYQM